MNQSFNLTILNFLISLQKGSHLLKPYSDEFKEFEYELRGIETQLLVSDDTRVTPEISFVSSVLLSTLLFETTITDVSNKIDQINRYNSINKKFLLSYFTESVLNKVDVPFIVGEKYYTDYEIYFKEKGIKFPLLRFEYDEENNYYTLELLHNDFSVDDVTKFFNRKIIFSKVNEYIAFDLDDIDKSRNRLINKSGLELISILTKSKKGDIFTLDDICEHIFTASIWRILSTEKQNNCKDIIKYKVLYILLNNPFFRKVFEKVDGSSFEVLMEDSNRQEILKSIRKLIMKFLEDYKSEDDDQIPIKFS